VWDTGGVELRGSVWSVIDGPDGPLHVAATARGVVAVEQLTTDEAFSDSLRRRGKGPVEAAADVRRNDPRRARLDAGIAALESFVDGRAARRRPPLDLDDRPDWDRRVLTAVSEIPWGRTASYGDIARRVGVPRAARAVGGAVGRNPISLLIPCHRVIASDGTIGGYGSDGWGSVEERLALKRFLLLREGITVRNVDR
jgi:methylated-DNA-[protein]-cysteine S-methyltransferase